MRERVLHSSGGGGIRTPGIHTDPPVFETGAFSQALPPHRLENESIAHDTTSNTDFGGHNTLCKLLPIGSLLTHVDD